mmetsp:Transcript_2369/g.4546  ORF Transcript_2369/g.4546 Transcript_2369/m.4546 type:complete len:264 (-) Transcript_2369:658-1449(-)
MYDYFLISFSFFVVILMYLYTRRDGHCHLFFWASARIRAWTYLIICSVYANSRLYRFLSSWASKTSICLFCIFSYCINVFAVSCSIWFFIWGGYCLRHCGAVIDFSSFETTPIDPCNVPSLVLPPPLPLLPLPALPRLPPPPWLPPPVRSPLFAFCAVPLPPSFPPVIHGCFDISAKDILLLSKVMSLLRRSLTSLESLSEAPHTCRRYSRRPLAMSLNRSSSLHGNSYGGLPRSITNRITPQQYRSDEKGLYSPHEKISGGI